MIRDYLRAFTRLVIASAACGLVTAHADVFGVISSVEVASGNGPKTFPLQVVDFDNAGNPVPVTNYTSPVLTASGSYTFGGSTVSGSATAWDTVTTGDGVELHGFASATLSGLCITCAVGTENAGLFAPIWYDSLLIGGLPNGTPVSLMFTAILHSTITGFGGTLNADVDVLGGQHTESIAITNLRGNANGTVTQSVIVDTVSGATLSLVADLDGYVEIADNTDFQTGTVDVADTADTYITVLTPGASYSAASGVNYAAPSAVPEPGSIWLIGAVSLAIWFEARRRSARGGRTRRPLPPL